MSVPNHSMILDPLTVTKDGLNVRLDNHWGDEDVVIIAANPGKDDGPGDELTRYFMRLFAAAPEMFAVLSRLGALLDFSTPLEPGALGIEDVSQINEAFAQARAALAKAEGR